MLIPIHTGPEYRPIYFRGEISFGMSLQEYTILDSFLILLSQLTEKFGWDAEACPIDNKATQTCDVCRSHVLYNLVMHDWFR